MRPPTVEGCCCFSCIPFPSSASTDMGVQPLLGKAFAGWAAVSGSLNAASTAYASRSADPCTSQKKVCVSDSAELERIACRQALAACSKNVRPDASTASTRALHPPSRPKKNQKIQMAVRWGVHALPPPTPRQKKKGPQLSQVTAARAAPAISDALIAFPAGLKIAALCWSHRNATLV